MVLKIWTFTYYFLYKLDYQFHLLFNKVNPTLWLYKLPFAKKHFDKKGIDPVEELNKAYKRPDYGLSSIWTGGFMHVLIFHIVFGCVNYSSAIVQREFNLQFYHFIIFL